MTERFDGVKQIRLPRVAISRPTNELTGVRHITPATHTLSRFDNLDNYAGGRRLSQIVDDFPIMDNNIDRPYYNSVPVRLRTAFDYPIHDPRVNLTRLEDFPATAAVCGLTNPGIERVFEPQASQPIVSVPSEQQLVASSVRDLDKMALFNNNSLSFQRICFYLTRFPAVALCIISTWMMWGRGLKQSDVTNNESSSHAIAFTTGIVVLTFQIIIPKNVYRYKVAKVSSNLLHLHNILAIGLAVAVIVVSSITFSKMGNNDDTIAICNANHKSDSNYGSCFTKNERVTFLGINIGSSILVILLSFFGGVYGCIGQSLLQKKRKNELQKFVAAQDNANFRY